MNYDFNMLEKTIVKQIFSRRRRILVALSNKIKKIFAPLLMTNVTSLAQLS
jgi:hypothetical protein